MSVAGALHDARDHATPGIGTAVPPPIGRRRTVLALGAILLLALALRLLGLGREPLWSDEAFTYWWVQAPFAALWGPRAVLETNPPLYYAIAWGALRLLGGSEAALRLPSAIIGTAGVAAVFFLGRLVGGTRAGLLAALLTALAAPHIYYSQEARTYALLSLLGTLAVLGTLLFCRTRAPASARGRIGGLALYALGALGALYAHNTGFVVPLVANLAALSWWLAASRRASDAAAWIVVNLVVLAAWSWWLPSLAHQAGGTQSISWLAQPSLGWALRDFTRLYGLRYLHGSGLAQSLPGCLVLAVALLALWLRPGIATATLAGCAFGLPALLFALGAIHAPLWIERAFFWPLPLALTLAAVACTQLRPAILARGLAGLVLAITLTDLGLYEAAPQKEPYREALARITASLQPRDAILLVPDHSIMSLAYYAERQHRVLSTYAVVPKTQELRMGLPYELLPLDPPYARLPQFLRIDDLPRLAADHDRLWVLYRRRQVTDPDDKVAAALSTTDRIVRDEKLPPFLELVLLENRVPAADAGSRQPARGREAAATPTAPPTRRSR